MDQVKIGRFISSLRKEKSMTQAQLAEQLGVTDRAVSKWETGKSMPDVSLMPQLCLQMGITLNELLAGERIQMKDYEKIAEENLLKMRSEQEKSAKRLLLCEVVYSVLAVAYFLLLTVFAGWCFDRQMIPEWMFAAIIIISLVLLLAACFFSLYIEQVAGYYCCKHCGHRYVPEYKSVLLAPHIGRTRHMKCPKCGERSWQKKVLAREEES